MRVIPALVLLLFSLSAWASSPVVIEAKRLEADNKKGWVLFVGDVVAVRDRMKITCDRMRVFTKKGKIQRIVATGHVRVRVGERIVTSEKATYYADEDKVVFEGSPQVWQGGNMVSGDVIVYYLKDDRTVVETKGGGKVKAVILPKEAGGGAGGK